MKHRKRNLLAALTAALLLTVTAAGSAAVAHDGSSGRADPSATLRPRPTLKVVPTRTPAANLQVDCSKITAAVAPTGVGRDWQATLRRNLAARICSLDEAKKLATTQVNGLIRQLQALNGTVAKSSLSDADKAQLKAEIDRVIAELTALKGKIAAETTLPAVQADLILVRQMARLVQAIRIQVNTTLGSLRVLAEVSRLDAQAVELQARILAAPSGIDTRLAQRYLDDMKARIADARALAGPLRERLLALTLEQLRSGEANPTLTAALGALRKATLDVWRARQDGRVVIWILAGKPGFEGRTPKPSATPAATPEITAALTA
jgi:hypothetical protein